MEQEFNVGLTNSKVYALFTARCFFLCPAEMLTQMLRPTGHVTTFSIAEGCSHWGCHGQRLGVHISGWLYTLLPSSHTSHGVKGDFHTIEENHAAWGPNFSEHHLGPMVPAKVSSMARELLPNCKPCFQFSLFLFLYVITEAPKAFSLRVTEIQCS